MRDFREGDLILLHGLQFLVQQYFSLEGAMLSPNCCNSKCVGCKYKNALGNKYSCQMGFDSYAALTAWVKEQKAKECTEDFSKKLEQACKDMADEFANMSVEEYQQWYDRQKKEAKDDLQKN